MGVVLSNHNILCRRGPCEHRISGLVRMAFLYSSTGCRRRTAFPTWVRAARLMSPDFGHSTRFRLVPRRSGSCAVSFRRLASCCRRVGGVFFPAPACAVYRSFSSSQPSSVMSSSLRRFPSPSIGMIAFLLERAAKLGTVLEENRSISQCFGTSIVRGSTMFHGAFEDLRVVTRTRSRRAAGGCRLGDRQHVRNDGGSLLELGFTAQGGLEAQPGRPARRRGRGVRRGDLDGAGQARDDACRSTLCGSGRGRWFGTAIPCGTFLLVDGDAEEVTVDEPTSAEWVIGEWVTLDRELHPFEALEVGDGH